MIQQYSQQPIPQQQSTAFSNTNQGRMDIPVAQQFPAQQQQIPYQQQVIPAQNGIASLDIHQQPQLKVKAQLSRDQLLKEAQNILKRNPPKQKRSKEEIDQILVDNYEVLLEIKKEYAKRKNPNLFSSDLYNQIYEFEKNIVKLCRSSNPEQIADLDLLKKNRNLLIASSKIRSTLLAVPQAKPPQQTYQPKQVPSNQQFSQISPPPQQQQQQQQHLQQPANIPYQQQAQQQQQSPHILPHQLQPQQQLQQQQPQQSYAPSSSQNPQPQIPLQHQSQQPMLHSIGQPNIPHQNPQVGLQHTAGKQQNYQGY